jgi:hypothetical protein
MLANMSYKIQIQYENMNEHVVIMHLNTFF